VQGRGEGTRSRAEQNHLHREHRSHTAKVKCIVTRVTSARQQSDAHDHMVARNPCVLPSSRLCMACCMPFMFVACMQALPTHVRACLTPPAHTRDAQHQECVLRVRVHQRRGACAGAGAQRTETPALRTARVSYSAQQLQHTA
jgi:hypothetical protein